MAGKLLVYEGIALPKSIIQMAMDGDEPPPQFVVKESIFGSNDSSASMPIPIIDLSLLSSAVEMEKLRSALSTVGCFQAIGHGIPSSFLDKVREVGKQFFALPVEEKQKYARSLNESEGYGNDKIVTEKQVLDWSYRLSLGVFPREKRKVARWPKNPSDFSELLDEYASKIESLLADFLLRSMARSLNLEEGSFVNQFGHALVQARFNFYPRCCRPDLVLGLKPHTDKTITVLLQDREVEGLQVLVDDKWVKVPTIPDAIIVNLGDHMQIMSNGIFKSPLHRVTVNKEKSRISVAIFYEPEPDKEIGPVEGLIDETRPRLYRNVTNYGATNYSSYQEGKIPLDTVKIR